MKTNYSGLWKSEKTGWYISKNILKKELQNKNDKIKILLRYNKYHEKDKNTPNFIFCFADQDTNVETLELNFETDAYEYILSSLYRIQELAYYGDTGERNNQYEIEAIAIELIEFLNKQNSTAS